MDVISGYNNSEITDAGIDIRFSLPTDEYNIPRWHYDGCFFYKRDIIETKFVVTLKGEGTMICESNENTRKEFFRLFKSQEDRSEIKNREILNNFLHDSNAKIIQVDERKGCLFIVADEDMEAIHSEPNITRDRIYISVVADGKKNIEDWYNRETEYKKITKSGDKKLLFEFMKKQEELFLNNAEIN
jgi:hypothetical protein